MVHFRPGEVVVCVNAQGVHLTKGRRYTVNGIRDNGLVDVTNDQNRRQGYKPTRFRRHSHNKAQPAP